MSRTQQMRPEEALASYVDEMLGEPTSPEPVKPVAKPTALPMTSPWRFFQFGSMNIALPGKVLRAVEVNGIHEELRKRRADRTWCYELCDSQQRPRALIDIERFLVCEEQLELADSTGNAPHVLEILDTEFALLLRGREVQLEVSESDVISSSTERNRKWLSGVSVEQKIVIIDLDCLIDIALKSKRK